MQVQNQSLVKPDIRAFCRSRMSVYERTVLLHDTEEFDDDF